MDSLAQILDVAAEKELSLSELRILLQIKRGVISPTDISKNLKLTTTGISTIGKRFIERGYLTKDRQLDDERIIHYSLTPQAQQDIKTILHPPKAS